MINFNFETPTRIIFGKGQVDVLASEIIKYSTRVLLVYGGGSIKDNGLYNKIVDIFHKNNIFYCELSGVKPNPRVSSVREGIKLSRENDLGFVLAVGGGSVIDCSKAIAAGVSYSGDVWDFMIKNIKPINPLPIGTILTLAATGSEMNAGAVISNDETMEKIPMRDESLKPKFSILDPELTFSVNPKHTAAGIADIMSHIFEQYFSYESGTDIQDHLAEAMLKTCINNGPKAYKNPKDYDARANLMWTSSLALNGLLNNGKGWGDWATHIIEHELSAFYDITHGEGLAIIHPYWMEHVLDETNAHKFASIGKNVFSISKGSDMEIALETINAIRNFFNSLNLPSKLKDVGIDEIKLEDMAKQAVRWGGSTGSYKKLCYEDVLEILKKAL